MARSIWKGPYIDKTIWKKLKIIANLFAAKGANLPYGQINQTQEGSKSKIQVKGTASGRPKPWGKIYSRRSMITPEFLSPNGAKKGPEGQTHQSARGAEKCEVHTGNKWINLSLNEDRIGHLFGEFAPTKKIAQFKRKAKGKKKK